MATKVEVFKRYGKEYWAGEKGRKTEILNHVCDVTRMHRKAAVRRFRTLQLRDTAREERRGRKTAYTPDVIAALKDVWEAASEPCGENLHSQIAEYVRILKRDYLWRHAEEATAKLLRMSCATMKRRVGKFAHIHRMVRGKSTTKPGAIHSLIPLRTGPWHDVPTGTLQIDTVAHCGDTVAGDFIYTVNAADAATLWGARRAQWQKGQEATVGSMEAMAADVPFPVLEWHPDSGSEFINWHCKGWCEGRGQELTRSRPNRKNDNCFVEERNGHIVRKWIGYARFDAPEVVLALNACYDILTPYLNHFIASKRIVSKERVGARWKVAREKKSLTPYQRVLARGDVAGEVKHHLREEHERLNPLLLKRELDRRQRRVFDIYKRYGKPKL